MRINPANPNAITISMPRIHQGDSASSSSTSGCAATFMTGPGQQFQGCNIETPAPLNREADQAPALVIPDGFDIDARRTGNVTNCEPPADILDSVPRYAV